jgi:hypothetical protein
VRETGSLTLPPGNPAEDEVSQFSQRKFVEHDTIQRKEQSNSAKNKPVIKHMGITCQSLLVLQVHGAALPCRVAWEG